ncbi:Tetracycline resistance protein [Durusdinium trenchii]|uniref:Class B n=1 Tax=Durusdinium trenchii TaxID=1381693 RepID=A0ABP0RDM6_9DINO
MFDPVGGFVGTRTADTESLLGVPPEFQEPERRNSMWRETDLFAVGTQALKPDPSNSPNPVQDYGNETHPPRQQVVLQEAYRSFHRVNRSLQNLDGFILVFTRWTQTFRPL